MFSLDFLSGNKSVFLFLIFLLAFQSWSQENLVPNGSFEDTLHCPNGTNDPGALSLWYNPTMASPDYYNACSTNGGGVPWNDWGYQYAQDGKAYIGLVTYDSSYLINYREYLQIKLINQLVQNKSYCWSFWISLLDSVDFASNNLGIALSNNPVLDLTSQSILPLYPIGFEEEIYLDRNDWKKVSGIFTAMGEEEYLTIGNFSDNSNTQFSQITTNSIGGPSAYYFVDNLFLGECLTETTFPNIISPNNDGINDYFSIKVSGVLEMKVTVVNRWGDIVYQGDENTLWNGKFQDSDCSEGVYFYKAIYKNAQLNKYETKTGFIQLIR